MEKNQEIWKTIIEFPHYEISNKGNIWSNKSNNFLKIINGDVKLYFSYNNYYTKSVDKLRRQYFPESNQSEVWKDIKDFSYYQISNKGNVWSKITCKLLKPDTKCVRLFTIEKKSKSVSKSIKKLVKQHFEEENQENIIKPYISNYEYLYSSLMNETDHKYDD